MITELIISLLDRGIMMQEVLIMRNLYELLKKLVQEKFWGEVIKKFKDGKPVLVTKQEKIKFE